MASVVFDRLWDEAYEREGELVSHAAALAGVYTIVSAGEALRLARGFADAGRPFFAYCDDAYNRCVGTSLRLEQGCVAGASLRTQRPDHHQENVRPTRL